LLLFGLYNTELYAEKTYTFLDFLENRMPTECACCEKGWIFRGETEKACDDLEERLKKCYEAGEWPSQLYPYSGGWGIVEAMLNAGNGQVPVKKILGEKASIEAKKAFDEFYELECFLAKNSFARRMGRTSKEWNETRQERLARLKREFRGRR
jgi:hypothetical protein